MLSAAAGEEVLPSLVMAWGGMCIGAAFLVLAAGTKLASFLPTADR